MATLTTFDGHTISYDLSEDNLTLTVSTSESSITLHDAAAYSVLVFLRQERFRKIPYRRTLREVMMLANLIRNASLDGTAYLRF